MNEGALAEHFFGRSECPFCGRWVTCMALHVCSTEQPDPPRPVVVDREPMRRLNTPKWEKA